MSKDQVITKLQVIQDMGDPQVSTLAGVMLEYITGKESTIGFKHDKTNNRD